MEDKANNDDNEEYKVEAIVDKRVIPCSGGCNGIIGCDCGGRTEYRIKWLGYSSESNTWEPLKHLYCEDLIEEFEKTYQAPNRTKSVKLKAVKRTWQAKSIVKRKSFSGITHSPFPIKSSSTRDIRRKRTFDNSTDLYAANGSKSIKTNKRKKSVEFKEPIVQEETLDINEKNKKGKSDGSQIDPSLQPEKIIGVADSGGELMFLTKWKGKEKVDLVPAREANVKFTDMVVRFYEDRIQWHAGNLIAPNSNEDEN